MKELCINVFSYLAGVILLTIASVVEWKKGNKLISILSAFIAFTMLYQAYENYINYIKSK